jgi:hypothetical protein
MQHVYPLLSSWACLITSIITRPLPCPSYQAQYLRLHKSLQKLDVLPRYRQVSAAPRQQIILAYYMQIPTKHIAHTVCYRIHVVPVMATDLEPHTTT